MFDDETDKPGPARAVVYDVSAPLPAPGDAGAVDDCGARAGDAGTGTATVSWQYRGASTSSGTGSFRILPDGSRTIGWGFSPLAFSEVDEAGHELLDFSFSSGDSTFRAIKVPLSAFDLNVLRRTAGGVGDGGTD